MSCCYTKLGMSFLMDDHLKWFNYITYYLQPDNRIVVGFQYHQWWYSWVGNDQVHEPWLDEALAMYSEYLYYERFYPNLLEWWWAGRVDKGLQLSGPIDRTIYDFADTRSYANVVYGRSAHFAHDLRQTVGDGPLFAFLKDYGRRFAYRIATGNDFWAVLQEHTPVDLTALRQEYFEH